MRKNATPVLRQNNPKCVNENVFFETTNIPAYKTLKKLLYKPFLS